MSDAKQNFKVKFFPLRRRISFASLLPNTAGFLSVDSSGLMLSRYPDGKERINTTWNNIEICDNLIYSAQISIRDTNYSVLRLRQSSMGYAVNFVPKTDEERQRFLKIAKRYGARISSPTELEKKITRGGLIGIFLFLAIVYIGVFFVSWKYR